MSAVEINDSEEDKGMLALKLGLIEQEDPFTLSKEPLFHGLIFCIFYPHLRNGKGHHEAFHRL